MINYETMEKNVKIIIGLGNPGKKYEHTRHNVGFDVLSMIEEKTGISINKKKFQALIGEGTFHGEKIVLALPQTYMNLSGESVKKIVDWYKIPMENFIVIYDDIDLPLGKVRMRTKGGAGTHNGMKSILAQLGAQEFPRIRVGIDAPPPEWDLADWVLSTYQTKKEREVAFESYQCAAQGALAFVKSDNIDIVMQEYNKK